MKSTFIRPLLIIVVIAAAVFVWRQYRQPSFMAGDPVPDFMAKLPTGEDIHLSDLRGKFVLLQFWGSWCGPCRAENPYLLQLYQRYHNRGFEIFSVGIEQNASSWQRAIQQDEMIWRYHTMEDQDFNGGLARQFNIHSIPTTFLINPQGVIMGVNHDVHQLEKVLDELLPK